MSGQQWSKIHDRPWHPISIAPDNLLIEVCGDSGYTTHRNFLALAIRKPDYRGRDWLDVQNNRLSDCGWEPTHWRHEGKFPA